MSPDKFKEAQRKLGLTNEKMAALLCISMRQVERMRQGIRAVSRRTALMLARALAEAEAAAIERDLRPSPDGVLSAVDAGLARLISAGELPRTEY